MKTNAAIRALPYLLWFIADNLVIYHPCAVPSGWKQWASRFRRFQIHFGDVRVVLTAAQLLPFHSARSNIFGIVKIEQWCT